MYHMIQKKHCYGNLTRIDEVQWMPRHGEFFHCTDYGWCDPCHTNSGHGMFKDMNGRVFEK